MFFAGMMISKLMIRDTVTCLSIFGNTVQLPREKLRFRPSVYAIIVHEGKILLVKSRTVKLLALPGGGVELGESLAEALKREVREETGMEVAVHDPFLHFDEQLFYYDPSDVAFHSFRFIYPCKPLSFGLVNDEDVDDGEVIEPRWHDIDGLKAEDFQSFGDVIVAYLKDVMATDRGRE